ncbi:MAG: tRNA (adenosine(37)-N6)-dimethylallyltransferase MiaA [Gammaproteobacteria bacterium]
MPIDATQERLPAAVLLKGPTASGKTKLAVELVRQLPFDIISVDSAMVYRGMDIGTAKPSAELRRIAPHRLIDILDPTEPYSAGRFRDDAMKEMAQIHALGRIPLLVGGTMLYFRALERGFSKLPQANSEVRVSLAADARQYGWQFMHRRLGAVDPESAQRIHPNDPQRIQRALEVYEITGRTLSELRRQGVPEAAPFRFVTLALMPADRERLHQRIERRFQQMLQQGFLNEVRGLYERGDLRPEMTSMRAVGYRQAWQYLRGDIDENTWIRHAVVATRQTAKRQMTWLRAEPSIYELPAESGTVLEEARKHLISCAVLDDLDL